MGAPAVIAGVGAGAGAVRERLRRGGGERGRVWLVTGASRGIGAALVAHALERGDRVIAGAREPAPTTEDGERLRRCRLDVTRPEDCAHAVQAALDAFGRLDVVANVAGVGLVGAVEETDRATAQRLFDVNLWGPANVLDAALPVLRAQRSGHVIQVSSLTGRIAAPGVGWYAATKFALEGLSESLHAELAPLGVHVTIVEPGGVRTDWAGSSLWHVEPLPDYAETAGRTREILAAAAGRQPTTPEHVAEEIAALVDMPDPPRRVVVGPDAVRRIGEQLELEREELERWGVPDPGRPAGP